MRRLRAPGGCPWDRKQTFDSIKPYTLEETYEVLDAIDSRDWAGLSEELGDLMLQPVFLAAIAEEAGLFTIGDSLQAINEKLVRRHPHIFGDATAETPEDVKTAGTRSKRRRRPGSVSASETLDSGRTAAESSGVDGSAQDLDESGRCWVRMAKCRRSPRKACRRGEGTRRGAGAQCSRISGARDRGHAVHPCEPGAVSKVSILNRRCGKQTGASGSVSHMLKEKCVTAGTTVYVARAHGRVLARGEEVRRISPLNGCCQLLHF